MNDGDLNWSVSELFDNVVDFNDNWDFSWKLNNVRNLHDFFVESFDFIDSGNFSVYNDEFFNNSWYFNYSVSGLNNRLRNSGLDLLKNFTNVGSDLFNLSNNISDDWFLNCTINLFNSHFFDFDLHDSLNFLDNLYNLFDISVDRDDLLNDTINWDWYFDEYDGRLFNFNNFFNFDNLRYDFFNFDFSRNFNSDFYDLL